MTTDLAAGEHWAENAPLADAFRAFDRDNPHVYAELGKLARTWSDRRPGQKLGIGMLWEVMRWNLTLRTAGSEPFKLNNNHRSFYARKLMHHETGLRDVFDTRGRDDRCECVPCEQARRPTLW